MEKVLFSLYYLKMASNNLILQQGLILANEKFRLSKDPVVPFISYQGDKIIGYAKVTFIEKDGNLLGDAVLKYIEEPEFQLCAKDHPKNIVHFRLYSLPFDITSNCRTGINAPASKDYA